MPTTRHPPMIDLHPPKDDFAADVRAGLAGTPMTLPCKYLYDEAGSQLFDGITESPDYYPTRTEMSILRRRIGELVDAVGPDATLIEFGSGSSVKTRLLLDAMHTRLEGYLPIDISRFYVRTAAQMLRKRYPNLHIRPVLADYGNDIELPEGEYTGRRVAFFPGSTIGNFEPAGAVAFLKRVRKLVGEDGSMILGVDLIKDPAVLHAAYNDRDGITAAFNLNLLKRIERELGATIDHDAYRHHAPYRPDLQRIEMHLVAIRDNTITIGDDHSGIEAGRSIHTESSHKHTRRTLTRLANTAGWSLRNWFTDDDGNFAVAVLG